MNRSLVVWVLLAVAGFQMGPDASAQTERQIQFPHAPSADSIYQPSPALSAAHPRYLLSRTPVATLKQRLADPAYAPFAADLFHEATYYAQSVPPASIDLGAEDPLRDYGNRLPWMALAYLLSDQPAKRALYIRGCLVWMAAENAWGLPRKDLALSHQIIGLATVYDWLYAELPPNLRAQTRAHLIDMARFMRSPENASAQQWRGTEFMANHNWFNYAAQAISAAVLWNDEEAPLLSKETKLWMDEAMQDFWLVKSAFGNDGAPVEGYLYQGYGDTAYFTFAELAAELTTAGDFFYDTPYVRKHGDRIFALLPDHSGFVAYADSDYNAVGGAAEQRRSAAYARDPKAQKVANVMDDINLTHWPVNTIGDPPARDWKNLFWFDPSVPRQDIALLPRNYAFPDLGLYFARSSWMEPDASFVAFKAGPFSGQSVLDRWGKDLVSGHIHPDEGSVMFYLGAHGILPGSGYAHHKATSNHALVVFDGRDEQAGRMVGQVGGDGPWFGQKTPAFDGDWRKAQRQARTLEAETLPSGVTSYLADLGGLYRLSDARAAGGSFFPEYLRRVVYLPSGAIIIADRIHAPFPRISHFRLPTAVDSLDLEPHGFRFNVASLRGEIVDASPQPTTRDIHQVVLPVFRHGLREVAEISAGNVQDATYVAILGPSEVIAQVSAKVTASGVEVQAPGFSQVFSWSANHTTNATVSAFAISRDRRITAAGAVPR